MRDSGLGTRDELTAHPRPLPKGEGRLRDQRSDKTLHWNEALRYRINGKEQAFQSNRPEKRRPARGNEARCRNFLTIKVQPHFGDRPDFALTSGSDDSLLPFGRNTKAVGEISRNHEESGATVNEQLYLLAAAGGSG